MSTALIDTSQARVETLHTVLINHSESGIV